MVSLSSLLEALDFLDNTSTRGTGAEIIRLRAADGVLNLAVHAELSGSASIPYKGDALLTFVPRKPFRNYVKTIVEQEVKFSFAAPELTVHAGKRRRAKFTAPAEPPKGYIDVDQLEESKMKISPEILGDLHLASFYTGKDDFMDLAHVFIVDGELYATNRISAFHSQLDTNTTATIPSAFIPLLAQGGRLYSSKSGIRYARKFDGGGNGWLFQVAHARAASFPLERLRMTVEGSEEWRETTLDVPRQEFLDALQLLGKLETEERVVTILGTAGSEILDLSAASATVAFSEQITLPKALKHTFREDVLIGAILPFIKEQTGSKLRFRWTAGSPFVLTCAPSKHRLIVPRRKQ